jgi:hypothetical protein
MERIRAVIPKGWTISYEAEYTCLNVKRDQPALLRPGVPNSPGEEKPKMGEISFAFRVRRGMSLGEYERLAAENARIQEEAYAIYKVLDQRKDISRKFDSFSPEKEEDKKLVARYEALKQSLHELPDFSGENLSLDWLINGPDFSVTSYPAEDQVFEEFDAARKSVMKVLTPYASKRKQR